MKTLQRGGFGFLFAPVLLVLFVAGYVWFWQSPDREISTNGENVSTRGRVSLRIDFDGLPESRNWHYELWERNPHGGEHQIGGIRVREGGTVTTLAGEPLTEFVLTEYPSPESEILLTIEDGGALSAERSDRVFLSGSLETGVAELSAVIPDHSGRQHAMFSPPRADNLLFDLSLPALPEGLVYRGWVVTAEGRSLPMASFRDPADPADSAVPGFESESEFLLADGRSVVMVSIDPDIYEPEIGQSPFMPIFSIRIPFQQSAGEPFSLDPVEPDNLPSGRVELRAIDG